MNARVVGRIPEADVLGYIWPEMTAVCPRCNQTKKKIDFHKSTKTKSGLYSCCKDCRKVMDSDRHATNKWRRFIREIDAVLDKYNVKVPNECIQMLSDYYVESEK